MNDTERRMSDTETLMWRLEKDPFLASSFANITILDRPPDMDRLVARMERAVVLMPRLRRRVQPSPGNFGNPTWVDDSDFDIRRHVRRIAIAAPGTLAQLRDLVTLLLADPFDRSRPLWQFIVVDGLEGGRSALVEKVHHTVGDGQGMVELSMHFLDLERDPAPLPPLDAETIARLATAPQPDATEALRDAIGDTLRIPIAVLRQVRDMLSDPASIGTIGSSTSATVKGVIAQLSETDPARSPLWTERSVRRRLETMRVPYATLRAAAKSMGGTLNTAFVTAAAHAAGEYHRALGAPVESLRASMAISTRTDDSGANAFSLVRMLVPTAEMPIAERFAAVNEILATARAESQSASLDAIAAVATLIPTSVVTRLARAQAETVDFATSNVRGAGVPLYMAGSKLLANYPVGPLAGVAFNVTLMSYLGSMDVGVNIDEAAVAEPELLTGLLRTSFAEISAMGGNAPPAGDIDDPSAPAPSPVRRRWWARRR
ncbi:MAG: wax ester/triacylglycerol synthase domain-containing protein [Actinomycetota bacterium]